MPKAADTLSANLSAQRAQEARLLAESVQAELVARLAWLEFTARALPPAASPAELTRQLEGLLKTEGARAAGLFDGTSPVVPILTAPGTTPEPLFARAPAAQALEQGSALAPPSGIAGRDPRVVLAARTPGRPVRLLVFEFSLGSIVARLEAFRSADRGAARLLPRQALAALGPVATAEIPLLGCRVGVFEPEGAQSAILRALRGRAILFGALGLACALLAGLLSARSALAPLLRLRQASLQVGKGARDVQVDTRAPEEISSLLRGFNEMSRSLQQCEQLGFELGKSGLADLSDLLQVTLEKLRLAVPFDRASALVRRADQLELLSAVGFASHDEARRLAPRDGAVTQALDLRAAAVSSNGTLLALPLVERGQLLGAVALESAVPFRLEQARLAQTFLGPATQLLGSARLGDEVRLSRTHDQLTALFNRRHFLRLARQLYETAHRFTQPLSAVLIDLDHLRAINELHGHSVGDEVLREVAARCRATVRDIDLLGRYGGEELAVLLPMTPRSAAVHLLPRLEAAVAERPIATAAGLLQVTISTGAASTAQGTRSVGDLLRLADAALGAARRLARAPHG